MIWWALTEGDRPICVDTEPHPNGNVVVQAARRDGTVIVHVLTKVESYHDRRQRFLPHKATCGGKPRPPITPIIEPIEQPELDLFNEGE